ncbi:MAG TPA: prealbumin-like fold domain-containing protein [Rhizomicrobium sp.]
MKSNRARAHEGAYFKTRIAILAACLSVLVSTAAGAIQTVPIAVTALTGADLIVKRGDGSVVTKMQTDDHGQITIKGLAPGDYVIEIDGPSFVAAMDRLAPPARHDSGPSVSLGIGGMFGGGGSHHSNGGARPIGSSNGGPHGDSAAGGAGLVVSAGATNTSVSIPVTLAINIGDSGKFSSTTPYCPDTAGRGMRFGFTVPKGNGAAGLSSEDPRVVGVSVGASW